MKNTPQWSKLEYFLFREEAEGQEKPKRSLKSSTITEESFIITERKTPIPVISAPTSSKEKSKPRTFNRIDRSKDRFPSCARWKWILISAQKLAWKGNEWLKTFESGSGKLYYKLNLHNCIFRLGNAEYRKGNYEAAMKVYTEAIENIRDSHILYINRALCFIKCANDMWILLDAPRLTAPLLSP